MMEGEGVAERAEGAGAAVASVDVGSVDVGAVDRVGIVSGGGASLEGATSLTEGEALPSLPSVTVSTENDGAATTSQVEEAPLSPIRRIDLDRIDASKTPTDQQIFDLSQILQINRKKGVLSSTVDFLLPPNKQHHRLPPPHVVAWDDFTWREVILTLYIWNRDMTLEQRQREMKKSSDLRIKNGPRYRQLLKKVEQLHNNRPSAVSDIAVPTTDSSGDDDAAAAAPSLLRRSTRAMDNERAQEMAELVVRARELANDPELQERARQFASAGTTQRRRAPAPAPAAAPVQIVGLGSAEADRMDVVQQREAARKKWKKRKRGVNCTSIGMQSDAQATTTVNAFHRTSGQTVETLHYSQLKDGEPTHAIMAVSFNELDTYNPDGGRSRTTGRRSKKPSLTITAESRGSAIKMLKEAAKALQDTRDAAVSPDGVYELDNVNLFCNFKDATTDTTLHDTIQQRHERFKKDNLSRPAIHHETMEQIQQHMPAEIAAAADMSPGVRDRRMSDRPRDE